MIACYMVWSGFSVDGVSALEYYADKRTYNHKGVTIPSQARYVFYFDRYLTHIRRQRKSDGVGVQGAGGVPAIGAGGVMIGGMAVVEHTKPEKEDKKKCADKPAAPEKQPEPEPVYASEAERLADTKRRMAAALAAAGVPEPVKSTATPEARAIVSGSAPTPAAGSGGAAATAAPNAAAAEAEAEKKRKEKVASEEAAAKAAGVKAAAESKEKAEHDAGREDLRARYQEARMRESTSHHAARPFRCRTGSDPNHWVDCFAVWC